MRHLLIVAALLCAAPAVAKTCTKGCPCGDTCISCQDTCHSGGGSSSSDPSTDPGGGCGCAAAGRADLAFAAVGVLALRQKRRAPKRPLT